jgi:hypothetical protein
LFLLLTFVFRKTPPLTLIVFLRFSFAKLLLQLPSLSQISLAQDPLLSFPFHNFFAGPFCSSLFSFLSFAKLLLQFLFLSHIRLSQSYLSPFTFFFYEIPFTFFSPFFFSLAKLLLRLLSTSSFRKLSFSFFIFFYCKIPFALFFLCFFFSFSKLRLSENSVSNSHCPFTFFFCRNPFVLSISLPLFTFIYHKTLSTLFSFLHFSLGRLLLPSFPSYFFLVFSHVRLSQNSIRNSHSPFIFFFCETILSFLSLFTKFFLLLHFSFVGLLCLFFPFSFCKTHFAIPFPFSHLSFTKLS